MRLELELAVSGLAGRQHGVVARRQLLELGMSQGAIARRTASGVYRLIHRGVYQLGPLTAVRMRESAAVLAAGPGAVVSHSSAAALWGLRATEAASRPVHITIAGANRGRRPGLVIHRVERLAPEEVRVRDGVPVTSPERTLIDLAASASGRELEAALAVAEREALVDLKELAALLRRHRARRGTRALRDVLESTTAPAFTRSEAEERFLALVRRARLPAPETNARVGRYEVDFLWRRAALAVEVDGFRHHSGRARFESDRRRDAWLIAGGVTVMRLTWRQITREPVGTAVRVGQALARAPDSLARAPDSLTRAPDSMARAPDSLTRAPDSMARAPDSMARAPASLARAPDSLARAPDSLARAPDSRDSLARAPDSLA